MQLQTVEISTKDPRTLVLLLDSSEATIQYKAVNALKKYMELAEHNCVELEELGILTKLSTLLRSDEAVRPYAAMCVSQMSKYPAIRRSLRKSEHLSALLPLLEPDQTLVCHVNVTAVLANVAGKWVGPRDCRCYYYNYCSGVQWKGILTRSSCVRANVKAIKSSRRCRCVIKLTDLNKIAS